MIFLLAKSEVLESDIFLNASPALHAVWASGMAMGQEDKFPLWQGSVELAQTLMMSLGVYCPFVVAAGFNVLDVHDSQTFGRMESP